MKVLYGEAWATLERVKENFCGWSVLGVLKEREKSDGGQGIKK